MIPFIRRRAAVTLAAGIIAFGLCSGAAQAATSKAAIVLTVDATEAPRHILHARLQIPAHPGPLTLLYPKWIPGEHGPTGPIQNVAGITLSAGGRPIEWVRDPEEMYAIHCVVPAGATAVDAAFDYLIEGTRGSTSSTPKLAVLDWNQVILYAQGAPAESLTVQSTLRVPRGWKCGTALPVERVSGNEIVFRPVSLVTLVDSPVLTGEYFRVVRLAPDLSPKFEVDLAADAPEALEVDAGTIDGWSRLAREAVALFGATHFREYHFLYALSDQMTYSGLEHHESSDNRSPEEALTSADLKIRVAQLFPHELSHSWNGKYRRPAGMSRAAFLEPMETDLLWVYEGLTDYLAWILAARSGLLTFDQSLADVAQTAAAIANEPGRSWRPLDDVARSAPFIGHAGRQWSAWRRGFGDVYSNGVLIWLEADAIIRNHTGGARSLDDFLRRFHGGESGGPMVKTYTLDDIVATLQEVAPYEWSQFFETRVRQVSRRSPTGGIEGNGWRLVYSDTLDPYMKVFERARKWTYLTYSVGLLLGSDGTIIDIYPDLSAAKAGLAPGMRLIAVNGRAWTAERGRAAIAAAQKSNKPIEVVAQASDYLTTYRIDYHGGERYPKLVRDPDKPDYLTALLSPKSSPR